MTPNMKAYQDTLKYNRNNRFNENDVVVRNLALIFDVSEDYVRTQAFLGWLREMKRQDRLPGVE